MKISTKQAIEFTHWLVTDNSFNSGFIRALFDGELPDKDVLKIALAKPGTYPESPALADCHRIRKQMIDFYMKMAAALKLEDEK